MSVVYWKKKQRNFKVACSREHCFAAFSWDVGKFPLMTGYVQDMCFQNTNLNRISLPLNIYRPISYTVVVFLCMYVVLLIPPSPPLPPRPPKKIIPNYQYLFTEQGSHWIAVFLYFWFILYRDSEIDLLQIENTLCLGSTVMRRQHQIYSVIKDRALNVTICVTMWRLGDL